MSEFFSLPAALSLPVGQSCRAVSAAWTVEYLSIRILFITFERYYWERVVSFALFKFIVSPIRQCLCRGHCALSGHEYQRYNGNDVKIFICTDLGMPYAFLWTRIYMMNFTGL